MGKKTLKKNAEEADTPPKKKRKRRSSAEVAAEKLKKEEETKKAVESYTKKVKKKRPPKNKKLVEEIKKDLQKKKRIPAKIIAEFQPIQKPSAERGGGWGVLIYSPELKTSKFTKTKVKMLGELIHVRCHEYDVVILEAKYKDGHIKFRIKDRFSGCSYPNFSFIEEVLTQIHRSFKINIKSLTIKISSSME